MTEGNRDFSVEPINILRPLESVTLNALGETATFECEVSKAGLKPTWLKNGEPMKRSDTCEMRSDGGVYQLVIGSAGADDEAEYTMSLADDVSTSASLTIKGTLLCHRLYA